MYNKELVTQERLKATPNGSVVIKSNALFHATDSDQRKKILAHQYTLMVQDNPEYDFGILMDTAKDEVTVSWNIRE
jgi:hypothetical protein